MRGSIKQRYKGSWTLTLDVGTVVDAATGIRKRRQKVITFHGTKKQAETKLTELVRSVNRTEFVEPTKLTVGEWLDKWLETTVKPPKLSPRTYVTYRNVVEGSLKPAIGTIRLQGLSPLDLERLYADRSDLEPATLQLHHNVISAALRAAERSNLVTRNVAHSVNGKPRATNAPDDLLKKCWTADEARAFLSTTKTKSPQLAAFYALAIDTGARKGELLGLRWSDVDLDLASIAIVRQLIDPGTRKKGKSYGVVTDPVFGPPKTKRPRTVEIGSETVRLLRDHKRTQAELKIKNRTTYRDHGLVFAREYGDLYGHPNGLGLPLSPGTVGDRTFKQLAKAAHVKEMTFHGLRHTTATLLLASGEPIKVVQERLGHTKATTTLNIYAHALPGMQRAAADRLDTLLHGT